MNVVGLCKNEWHKLKQRCQIGSKICQFNGFFPSQTEVSGTVTVTRVQVFTPKFTASENLASLDVANDKKLKPIDS